MSDKKTESKNALKKKRRAEINKIKKVKKKIQKLYKRIESYKDIPRLSCDFETAREEAKKIQKDQTTVCFKDIKGIHFNTNNLEKIIILNDDCHRDAYLTADDKILILPPL